MDCGPELMQKLLEKMKPKTKTEKIAAARRDLARALLEAGRTYREVAQALDISIGSVHNIAKEPPEKTLPLVNALKARAFAKHLLLADHILNTISDYNIANASLKEKVVCAAILADKAFQMELDAPGNMPGKTSGIVDAPVEQVEQKNRN